ncbi:MAG: HAD hydrolase-like protein [Treponema sp.]|jgi:putative hydrolase of the HAD superfamily|nr:HAD hydrolase-like protein [Treponema sp.]
MRTDIEGVAFDLDGTLYPNFKLYKKIIPVLLKELPLMIAFGKARNIIREEQGTSPNYPLEDFYTYQAEFTAKILKLKQYHVKEKIDRIIYTGWEPLFKNIKLFTNAAETLYALKEAGYKTGLLSDFPAEKKLENLGIAGGGDSNLWDAVLCSEHYGVLKPHPLPFNELARAMALPAGKILYVGNNRSYDVAGAHIAGMKTAWIKSPFSRGKGCNQPPPGFCFSNYRQLYDYMLN